MASTIGLSRSIITASLVRSRLELRLPSTHSSAPMTQWNIPCCLTREPKESTEGKILLQSPVRYVSPTDIPPDYERHKLDSISKQKAGRGHWKPELATESEEAVKADRAGDTSYGVDNTQAMKELQDRTKGIADKTLKAGTSMSEGL